MVQLTFDALHQESVSRGQKKTFALVLWSALVL
jgi:hypothetical protein